MKERWTAGGQSSQAPEKRNRPDDSGSGDDDGIEDYFGETMRKVIPQPVVRRTIEVSIGTDRETYSVGEPVGITLSFFNRLPFPVRLETPTPRLWGWAVDGMVDASEERPYLEERLGILQFRPRERKERRLTWSGQFKRVDERTHWESAEPGTHEISGFLGNGEGLPRDSTTVEIR
ncbi:MAG: hypothetical protein V5A46_03820 [Haloferacaceae archaeon]